MPSLEIEIFSAPRCGQCAKARKRAQKVVADLQQYQIGLRVVDIVEELDYAVRMGLRSAPAIAINGELVFPAIPSETELKQAILKCLEKTD
jgi:glutaredoxin